MTTKWVYYKQNPYHFLKMPYRFRKNIFEDFKHGKSPHFYAVLQGFPAVLLFLADVATHIQQTLYFSPM